ncbi:hypothetical protein H5410_036158 [Solanum commersonii]|uniref:Flavin-containing monooxygenase n=1 Tax=Solanum commersonii TaxID=4109 RepID=A0A9J5Y7B8_SOLCO|nr:hypothetical protein H5410_036158 [Solanum commersonii]
MPKKNIIQYLDEHVEHFNIKPKFQTCVESAFYNFGEMKWNVKSRNLTSGEIEMYANSCPNKGDGVYCNVIAKIFSNIYELGIPQPEEGPFSIRVSKGRSPVIDVGAIDKIKFEQIKDHTVVFDNGDEHQFDAIIFATRYKNIVTKWLKDYSSIFLEDGTLIYWKGDNGLYCAGFSKIELLVFQWMLELLPMILRLLEETI